MRVPQRRDNQANCRRSPTSGQRRKLQIDVDASRCCDRTITMINGFIGFLKFSIHYQRNGKNLHCFSRHLTIGYRHRFSKTKEERSGISFTLALVSIPVEADLFFLAAAIMADAIITTYYDSNESSQIKQIQHLLIYGANPQHSAQICMAPVRKRTGNLRIGYATGKCPCLSTESAAHFDTTRNIPNSNSYSPAIL
jgi:hypothetical protein